MESARKIRVSAGHIELLSRECLKDKLVNGDATEVFRQLSKWLIVVCMGIAREFLFSAGKEPRLVRRGILEVQGKYIRTARASNCVDNLNPFTTCNYRIS